MSSKQLCDADTGKILVPHLEIAANGWQRAVGLIGRRKLEAEGGLWLHPCNGIHTFGVRFPIDVLFLDGNGKILRTVSALKRCRLCGPVWKAKTVVELPANTLQRLNLTPGQRIKLVS